MFTRVTKSIGLLVSISVFAIVLVMYYMLSLSPEAREGKRNQANLKRVKIGMKNSQALAIMGKPKSISRAYPPKEGLVYEFVTPPSASSDLYIHIGKDSSVQTIGIGD